MWLEPVIQQQGADRIVVQLPGVQDVAKAKDILGRTRNPLRFAWLTTPWGASRGLERRGTVWHGTLYLNGAAHRCSSRSRWVLTVTA